MYLGYERVAKCICWQGTINIKYIVDTILVNIQKKLFQLREIECVNDTLCCLKLWPCSR